MINATPEETNYIRSLGKNEPETMYCDHCDTVMHPDGTLTMGSVFDCGPGEHCFRSKSKHKETNTMLTDSALRDQITLTILRWLSEDVPEETTEIHMIKSEEWQTLYDRLEAYIAQSNQLAVLEARIDQMTEDAALTRESILTNRTELQQALDTLKQQNLIDFVSEPKTVASAVEGSMEKRQAGLDTLKKESEL